jgi:hypothetical protein
VRKLLGLFFFLFLFSACRQDAPAVEAPADQPQSSSFVVSTPNYNLVGSFPEQGVAHPTVQVEIIQPQGIVQVSVGKDFVFYVKQEAQSVETIREDLRAQDLFDLIFFDTQPDAVFYETILPDGNSAGHHYIRCFQSGNQSFVAYTDDTAIYNYYTALQAGKLINSLAVVQ